MTIKRILVAVLALALAVSMCALAVAEGAALMSYANYAAAAMDDEVTIAAWRIAETVFWSVPPSQSRH